MRILEVALSGTVGTQHMGPVSTDICELSNNFAARGHEVILADIPCNEPRRLLRPGIKVVEVVGKPETWADSSTRRPLLRVWRRWLNYLHFVRRLASQVDLRSMDVVHVHAPEVAFILQRLYSIKCAYTAHTSTWSLAPRDEMSAAPRSLFARIRALNGRFHAWVERNAATHSDVTIGLSGYLAKAIPEANIQTIPNGLNLDEWQPLDRADARRALGFTDGDFVVLFTGRVAPVKGVDLLLAAVKSLAPELPRLKAFVIGPLSGSFDTRDDRVDEFAQAMMDDARGLPVRFLGFVNKREMLFRQYLTAADVFVLPSRREPQGLVVLEAMAMGTPIIGSATGGIPDMVASDVGYLFPPGDVCALAARIRAAHDNPQQLSEMRSAARQRVQRYFRWDTTAEKYLEAFACCGRMQQVPQEVHAAAQTTLTNSSSG